MINNAPIGIFDSGVGGLTVFKEIRKRFPTEDIIYFGDMARVPYGPKSKETIIQYSIQNAQFLLQKGVKIIVIACNTSSAMALDVLKNHTDVFVIGVIKAGAKKAVETTKTGRIGVIGTDGTVNSHAYLNAIKDIQSDVFVIEKSTPLFVPLAEEGWHESHITKQIAEIYLKDILAEDIDTLVLGCTHYPILKKTIQEVCGEKICLIDSAEAVSNDLKIYIDSHKNDTIGKNLFYVSDGADRFGHIASDVLGIKDFELSIVKI